MSEKGKFELARETTIAAPSERVYALIENFKNWQQWSPWEGLDPDLNREYSGPEAGVGSNYHWSGNRKVGEGNMKITDASSPSRVEIALSFLKPWKAENVTTFDLTEADGATKVVWTMTGVQSFGQRLMGKIFSMEKIVGKDFEKGLAQLKDAAESPSD